jgi:L-asparagine oxygenase
MPSEDVIREIDLQWSGLPPVDAVGRGWSVAEPHDAVFTVDPLTAADIVDTAHRLAAKYADADGLDNHELLVDVEVAMRRMSPELIAALVDFRLTGSRDGVMKLRGLPLDDPLPPTPVGGAFFGSWRELKVSTVTQLMTMSILGDVVSYKDEKEGFLIQDVCPLPGAEKRQENSGSCLLKLHTEDGFHPHKPHFISLLCLRPDHFRQALTVAGGIRAAVPLLDSRHLQTLREPYFRTRLSSSFVGSERTVYSPPMPVLSGSSSDPDLCIDLHATEAMTEAADSALAALSGHLIQSLVGTVLGRGDMLIIDNRKAVHGRTPFSPRYDGQDRWLRRCFTVTDVRASSPLLYPESRVHRPLDTMTSMVEGNADALPQMMEN